MAKNVFIYDGTFEGVLTAVFESYDRKIVPDVVCTVSDFHPEMFCERINIDADEHKSERVWNALTKKCGVNGRHLVYNVFLSGYPEAPGLILSFLRRVFETKHSIVEDFGDEVVLKMWKISRKVAREAERVKMFVRFQRTADDIYFACFDPQYDVLPLSAEHFRRRFRDQQWVVYDTRRGYGYYYDLKNVSEIRFLEGNFDVETGKIDAGLLDKDELLFQKLWKIYFREMEIKERHNVKLHKQLMPKRFWKYMTEKQSLE